MKGESELPPPPPNFSRKKGRILAQLAVPDAEYSDASPKGSVDAGIRELIDEINVLDGFVTTSSCAGRVSVFVEGRKAGSNEDEEGPGRYGEPAVGDASRPATLATVGGKGGGGTWLFVSHDPVQLDEGLQDAGVKGLLGMESSQDSGQSQETMEMMSKDMRLIHFKFEPMILHVLTASLEHAQLLLRCGLQAGFRESGAINLTATLSEPVTPIVAIRSMGLAFESLIGVQTDGIAKSTVSEEYLHSLLRIANDRFKENRKRIQRFRDAVLDADHPPKKKDGSEWEDAEARRERKRAEGLRRKAELQGQNQKGGEIDKAEDGVVDLGLSMDDDLT
ncbi:methyltransferase TYW3-domain-containing protein [Xylariaceae sp. FL1651]|nr:methyltransferase TYW3-domain-containing protein [Xylariaceae sp. FL1651]